MNEAEEAASVNYVLTLDELSALTREGGKPAETLMNVVALIAKRFHTDVCSAYLLEPDRANLVLAATLGLRRECIGTLRMALHEGLAGMVAEEVRPVAVEEVRKHPRFKFFGEAGEEGYHSFLGVPLIDRGVLQGVLVVQTVEARSFSDEEMRMLGEAAAQVAPVVSEARTLDRFIAPAQERLWALARNLWWCWDADTTSLFRDLDPVRWRELKQQSDLAVERDSAGDAGAARRRAEPAQPDQLRVPAAAGVSEGGPHLGRDACGGAAAPAGGLLFGRVRPARIGADLFGRPGGAGGRPHQERVGSGHSADRRSACFTGRATSASGWMATGGSTRSTYRSNVTEMPMEPAIGPKGEPVKVQIETRGGTIRAKVWRMKVGRCDLLLLDSNVDGNAPEDRELTSRLYGGDGRVRIRQELLLGVGGYRALRAMGITPGVLHMNEGHSGFAVLEAIRCRMEEEGIDFDSGGSQRWRAKWSSRRTRRCPRATTVSTRA